MSPASCYEYDFEMCWVWVNAVQSQLLSTRYGRKGAENHGSPSVSLLAHSTPNYPTNRTTLDLTMEDNAHTPKSNSNEQPHHVQDPTFEPVAVHARVHESTHKGGEVGQRETVLGKRTSSERNLTSPDPNIQLCCEESVDAEHKCKVRRTDNSSSNAVTLTKPNTDTAEELVSKSKKIVEEFDNLFASPEIVFDFDQPEAIPIPEQKVFDQGASSYPQNQRSESDGYQNDPVGIGLMQENEDLQRAMEESLKAQVGMFNFTLLIDFSFIPRLSVLVPIGYSCSMLCGAVCIDQVILLNCRK